MFIFALLNHFAWTWCLKEKYKCLSDKGRKSHVFILTLIAANYPFNCLEAVICGCYGQLSVYLTYMASYYVSQIR